MLVGRLRQGEAEAFDQIYAVFNKPLFTFLIRLARHRDVAEDLHEETWLRLVKHADRLHADTRLGPWLFTVARNLYVSYRRSRALEDSAAAGLIGLWPFGPRETSPFEKTAANELERRIERALAHLPAASREVLLLVGISGLDQSEVADICGITPAALRQRLHRAREMLAQALDRDAVAPSVLEGVPSCPTR